jgi:hypothetical protein
MKPAKLAGTIPKVMFVWFCGTSVPRKIRRVSLLTVVARLPIRLGPVDRRDGHVELDLAETADRHGVDDGDRHDRLVLGRGHRRHAADQHSLGDAEDQLNVLGVGHGPGQDDGVDAGGDRFDGRGGHRPPEDRLDRVDVEFDDEVDLLLDPHVVGHGDPGRAGLQAEDQDRLVVVRDHLDAGDVFFFVDYGADRPFGRQGQPFAAVDRNDDRVGSAALGGGRGGCPIRLNGGGCSVAQTDTEQAAGYPGQDAVRAVHPFTSPSHGRRAAGRMPAGPCRGPMLSHQGGDPSLARTTAPILRP